MRELLSIALLLLSLSHVVVAADTPHVQLRSFDGTDIVRIGTGRDRGVYAIIGQRIALGVSGHKWRSHISQQPLEMLGVPQYSGGSVANIEDLKQGAIEMALVQADLAFWAYHGSGQFQGHEAYSGLRAIANLYPEDIHVLVRNGIVGDKIDSLKGLKVSIGEPGSGSLVDSTLILNQANLMDEITPLYFPLTVASDKLGGGEVDAIVSLAGYPVHPVETVIGGERGRLIGLSESLVSSLVERYPYFIPHHIPKSAYGTDRSIRTVAVGALLLVDAQTDENLVHALTSALWRQSTLDHIRDAHPQGYNIRRERALKGLSVPLHPGAARYYRELGMIKSGGVD